jgi:hypothetical protein
MKGMVLRRRLSVGRNSPGRKAGGRRHHDCSRFDQAAKRGRRGKIPSQAILMKAVVPDLMSLSDTALRVYLARSRFANRSTGLSYPGRVILLRALGSPSLYTCWFCGGLTRFLTKDMERKREVRTMERAMQLLEADEELAARGLIRAETLTTRTDRGEVEFDGVRLLMPGGDVHRIPKRAAADTFFIIPDPIFACGAPGLWRRLEHGFEPVSEDALKLLLALLSENDEGRYGGVDPHLMHRRLTGELRYGHILSSWDVTTINGAMRELRRRSIITAVPAVVSTYDQHVIRFNDQPRHSDEIALGVLRVATGGRWPLEIPEIRLGRPAPFELK